MMCRCRSCGGPCCCLEDPVFHPSNLSPGIGFALMLGLGVVISSVGYCVLYLSAFAVAVLGSVFVTRIRSVP